MSVFAVVKRGNSAPSNEEREKIVDTLTREHLFNLEKLLAWPNQLMKLTWWNSIEVDSELVYSSAMDSYLAHVWPTEDFPTPFAEQMEAVAEILYLSRSERYRDAFLFGQEIHFVHDMVLLLLDQQIDRLKTVWQLDQPIMANYSTNPVALANLDLLTQRDATEFGFADWVLDTWLPAHLLFYGRKAIEKEEAEKAARAAANNGDARRFNTGGSGDLSL